MLTRNIQICTCRKLRSLVPSENSSSHTLAALKRSAIYRTPTQCLVRYYDAARGQNNLKKLENVSHGGDEGTVSNEEVEKFKLLSSEWWRSGGQYTPLYTLNKLRVPFIRDLLLKSVNHKDSSRPLKGFKILDVGCGGGILAEPLARLGAEVVGIDPVIENIEAAKSHAMYDKDLETLSYKCTTIEEVSENNMECFDVVVASEVVEHVYNPSSFIGHCCDSIKPGGHMVVTTINRTILSTLLAKYAAEYLLRIVPQNTHDEDKFVTPDELTDMLRENDMVAIRYRGMLLNPLTYSWSWTDSYPMNYACSAQKPSA